MKKKNAQTTLEYVVLGSCLLIAFLAISHYYQRALSGRWRASADDLGDQYDPRVSDIDMTYKVFSNTAVRITTIPDSGGNGLWTIRRDFTNTVETKKGKETVSSY